MTKKANVPTIVKKVRNEEAWTKLVKARVALIMNQPFFGQLALRLQMVEDDTLSPPTLATDGRRFLYHPKWVLDNPPAVVMSGVAHEVGHCIFEHIGRRGGREHVRWNHAGDYVINATLKDAGFTVPPEWLHNKIYADMSADQIYNALPPNPPGNAFDMIMDALGGAGGTSAKGSASGQQLQDEWKIATVQAANSAKAAGKLPGSLERFVEDLLHPPADWKSVLRRFVTEVSKDDYSYQRLNRRYASIGIYLPGLYSEAMGEIDIAVDTSGSIGQDILNAFGAEISDIRAAIMPLMTRVIYCDARVNHVDEFEKYDILKLTPHGGGGTDFNPPFDMVQDQNWEPKCFIYLTDGYGPFPPVEPDYPVLWLMTTDIKPPWGEVIRIEV